MKRSTIQFKFTTSRRPQVLAARFGRRAGFSLIEVAIAMAIFVFGALAIVRIFPGALSVVQNSEQRAIGQRMAQSTLTTFTAQPRSVPNALFDTNSALTNSPSMWSDFPGAVFGTNSDDNLSLSQAAPEAGDLNSANSSLNQSAMGHFRRVSSETHRVGANGEILLNFPYLFGDPTPANFKHAINPILKIRHDIEGVTLDGNGGLDFRNASLDGMPFRNTPANPNRPPNQDTTYYRTAGLTTNDRNDVTFYVSYNWTSGGYTNGVQDEPKKFHEDATWTDGISQVVAHGGPTGGVVPGPVKIWFYSSVAAATTEQGKPNFDPNLGRLTLATTDPRIGQLVSIDYTVPDWRFIVTDSNLTTQISEADTTYLQDQGLTPGANNNITQLVLPTRYVADVRLGDDKAQLYALLRGRTSTGATVVSRAAWSPDYTAAAETANVRQADTNNPKPVAVRPKTGQVFFDTNSMSVSPANPLVSPMARVVYRNLEGWVQQPAIAANFYAPYIDGANRDLFPREPWREYFYLPNETEKARKPIFFHASEAGKSVTVSYVYQVGTDAPITMKDVPIPIEGDVIDRPVDSNGNQVLPALFNLKYISNGAPTDCTKVSRAYLRDNEGHSIGADTNNGAADGTAKIIAITEIRGASIRVRSGWFSGDRYTQTGVVGYRPLDVESYNRS